MTPFTAEALHDHPLTPNDWVLEIGGHLGQTAHILTTKYGCTVVAYEPVTGFWNKLAERFEGNPLVVPINCGVGATTERAMFGIHGDRSGRFTDGDWEYVYIDGIADAIDHWVCRSGETGERWLQPSNGIGPRMGINPTLIQINAEGDEYTILRAILEQGLINRVNRLQVQFHSVVEGAKEKRDGIRRSLAFTHEPLWEPPEDLDVTWDGWKRRGT